MQKVTKEKMEIDQRTNAVKECLDHWGKCEHDFQAMMKCLFDDIEHTQTEQVSMVQNVIKKWENIDNNEEGRRVLGQQNSEQ